MMIDSAHHERLAQVAAMYYEQDMTQSAIAEALDVSRVKVYRWLREAREEGVVQIWVDWPITRDAALEARLKETFGLQDALVLKSSHQPTLNPLGQMTARYLEGLLPQMHTMAVCLGRTTYEVIHAIRNDFQAQVQIVQAIGSLPHSLYEWDSAALARQLAHKLGGDVLYLSSPLMVDSPEAAQVIFRQRDVEHTLSVARGADLALVGIGNLDPKMSGFVSAEFFKDADLRGWLKAGAVGDMGWRIFDADGKPFQCAIDDRVIGLTLDEYVRIPITLAVAAGVEKADAIRGALRTGAVDIIATDDYTATAVLKLST